MAATNRWDVPDNPDPHEVMHSGVQDAMAGQSFIEDSRGCSSIQDSSRRVPQQQAAEAGKLQRAAAVQG